MPDGKVHFGTIGTAIDYRFRYYFRVTPFKKLVASKGAEYWVGNKSKKRKNLLIQFISDLHYTTRRLKPVGIKLRRADEIILARYCYVLALFEQLYRAGIFINSPLLNKEFAGVDEMLHLPSLTEVNDISSLSSIFYDEFKSSFKLPVVLNPTFAGSADVGGADADLILDGCLVDIKGTKRPGIQSKWIYQILGYVLLDYDNKHLINGLGLYLARKGLLLKWDLKEALKILSYGSPGSLHNLRRKFRKLCRNIQGDDIFLTGVFLK